MTRTVSRRRSPRSMVTRAHPSFRFSPKLPYQVRTATSTDPCSVPVPHLKPAPCPTSHEWRPSLQGGRSSRGSWAGMLLEAGTSTMQGRSHISRITHIASRSHYLLCPACTAAQSGNARAPNPALIGAWLHQKGGEFHVWIVLPSWPWGATAPEPMGGWLEWSEGD